MNENMEGTRMEEEGMREEKSSEITELPPGFRFHPTDDELVFHYLCRKVAKQDFPSSVIAEVDLYKYDPWDLPSKAFFGKHEWYFFTCRDRKYPKGSRPSRSAGSGYWKVTGAEKPISSSSSRHTAASRVGVRKALVFYQGKAPRGVKTDWIMHEYRLADRGLLRRKPDDVVGAGSEGGTDKNKAKAGAKAKGPWQEEWVLCRLYNKQDAWVTRKTMHAEEAEEYFCVEPEDGVDAQLQPQPNPNPNLSLQPVLDQGDNAVDVAPSTEVGAMASANVDEDVDWFADLELDEL